MWPWNRVDRRDVLIEKLVEELSAARRDAVAQQAASAETLDRIVANRYDRPERVIVPQVSSPSPISTESRSTDPYDDATFVRQFTSEESVQ